MIQIKGLRKYYWSDGARITAVDGIDVEIAAGEMFMLLGRQVRLRRLRCVVSPYWRRRTRRNRLGEQVSSAA